MTSPARQALQAHHAQVAPLRMRDLFDLDPGRFEKFTLGFEDILLDFSKNRITG
jgi:glucose-6-phosphate isomerase